MADRPSEQAKRGRCNAQGPRPYQSCGRWKGHEGPHREMCAHHPPRQDEEWADDPSPEQEPTP